MKEAARFLTASQFLCIATFVISIRNNPVEVSKYSL